jgi:N-hydroxyarylamine O-acetyltransferase
VLVALGYIVTALGGRVVSAFKGEPAPLTHRLTLVDLPEGRYIADVGFGGNTPTAPLRLEPDIQQATPHGIYRLIPDGDVFELQFQVEDRWAAVYRFTLAPQSRIDFEVANWFTSTHPRSLFTQNLIACRVVGDTRFNLRNANLSIRQSNGRTEHRVLASADDLRHVLEDGMQIALPTTADAIWAKVPRSS